MNSDKASQYMDKQIMDLSNSSISSPVMTDLLKKKDEIIPSYDFMPIRPLGGSSSPPPPATHSADFGEDLPVRTWSSFDSKTSASAIRNYSSVDADEPTKFTLGKGKNQKPVDASLDVPANASMGVSLIAEIDKTIKKHADDLMHAINGVSARLTQLETRTRNLEHLVDDLKMSVENTHESTDEKMRQLENILTEVLSSVNLIKDKQEIAEAQFRIAKHYLPQVERVEDQNTAHTEPTQAIATPAQQFSNNSISLPAPNAPPTPPNQNYPPQLQLPNQFPQNQVTPIVQEDPYFPKQSQASVNQLQQYQLPPHQLPQHSPPPQHSQHPPVPNQYPPPHQTQYSQPPPPPSRNHPEEITHSPSQLYSSGIRQPPSTGAPMPPSQQFYGPTPSGYEPPSSRPGYSGSFGPGHVDPAYPYSNSGSSYGSGSLTKQQSMGQSSGNSYQQLPTARILPQAGPTPSGSGGSGNKVPIDDVVDKVTNMGFSRDQVRATVRKLTENGQAVDLNIVLDKLMNDGDGQAPGGWYGR